VKAQIKALEKVEKERDERVAEINRSAERETAEVQEAIIDLQRICTDPEETSRYFLVAEKDEIEENEFNLNLPRYINTWEVTHLDPVATVVHNFQVAAGKSSAMSNDVLKYLKQIKDTRE
jgi:type I restriction enzyme M protein